MLHFFWNFITFIIAISILITVHELGHFLVARHYGVTVKRFSVGFGRTLWHFYDKYNTEYVIALIPLGGYVTMLDTRLDHVLPENYDKTFNYKTCWERSAIIIAGPIFNLLFAIFAYWFVFINGLPGYRPVIDKVIPNSIAAYAKISPGMELKSIDGIKTPDWDSVRMQLINKIGNNKTILDVIPLGATNTTQKILNLRNLQFEPHKQDIILTVGMIPVGLRIEPILTKIQPGSAAMKAGLQVGDKIIDVDGLPVLEWQLFINHVRNHPNKPIQVQIDRHGKVIYITLIPNSKLISYEQIEGVAGVTPNIIPLSTQYKTVRQYSPLLAITHACEQTWQIIRLTVNMLIKLVTGDIKLNNLSGPISIAQSAGISAEYGVIYYLMFLALISINLGIINLFPLPILDGGHLFFLLIEKIKGKPISQRMQDFIYCVSSILLALIISLAIFNDISRLL